jgi:hypothetical protein
MSDGTCRLQQLAGTMHNLFQTSSQLQVALKIQRSYFHFFVGPVRFLIVVEYEVFRCMLCLG